MRLKVDKDVLRNAKIVYDDHCIAFEGYCKCGGVLKAQMPRLKNEEYVFFCFRCNKRHKFTIE